MTNYTFTNINLDDKFVNEDGTLTTKNKEFFRSLKGGLDRNFNSHGIHAPNFNANELSQESKTDNGVLYFADDTGDFEGVQGQEIVKFSTTLKSNPAIKMPVVPNVASVQNPEKGWIVFDEALDKLQVYTSLGWMDL